jgi:Na+/melibiose symporter-like transporter
MFDLEQSIADWRRQMLAAGIKTPVPLEELEIHLREEIERQMKSGLNEQKAFEISVQQIGQSENIEIEFKKIERTFMKKNLMCKIIRFWGLLFSVWTIPGIFIAFITSAQYGAKASLLHYCLTVTIPYLLLAILIILPFSKLKDGSWKVAFTLLCLSGGYVCLYLVTHLPSEEWLMIYVPWLLILSQPIAIWISRRKMSNQTLEQIK